MAALNILETEPASQREELAGVQYGAVKKVTYYSTICKR